jgi:hypothetical protein
MTNTGSFTIPAATKYAVNSMQDASDVTLVESKRSGLRFDRDVVKPTMIMAGLMLFFSCGVSALSLSFFFRDELSWQLAFALDAIGFAFGLSAAASVPIFLYTLGRYHKRYEDWLRMQTAAEEPDTGRQAVEVNNGEPGITYRAGEWDQWSAELNRRLAVVLLTPELEWAGGQHFVRKHLALARFPDPPKNFEVICRDMFDWGFINQPDSKQF